MGWLRGRAALAALTATACAAVACSRPSRLSADLVIVHANVWTGNAAQPAATAVAIIGDRIVDVGSDDQIEGWRGAATGVIDGEGRRLVPGFNDANVRLVDGGSELDEVDLRDAGSAAEFARRINERAKAKPGEWILGGHWDESRWTPAELPTRALIDDITNSSPVFVIREDGRAALANAAALGRAGVTEQTPDPPGGALVRGANGFPTGVLQGTAMAIVSRVVPERTADQRLRATKRALELAESLGVTSVQDQGSAGEDIGAFAELANRGELTLRIYALPPEAAWYDQAKLGIHRAFGSPWLRLGGVQASVDPALDADARHTRLMAADHAGLQVSIGAAGAAAQALRLLGDIAQANGGRDRRFRIDGAQPAVPDVDRLAALNAIAVLRPNRADTGRTLLDKHVRVAAGSGWPSAALNPMTAIAALVAARLTPAEALAAYTSGSAFAEFQESDKGTIARGQLADLVILSGDLLSMPAAQIKDVSVLTTIVGGKIVHQRKP